MAIYHLAAQIIGRSQGRSAVGAAAYRAGERIVNEYDGMVHDYTRRSGVIYTAMLAPETAPAWMQNRAALWNAIEKIEKRKDAQLARELNIALPVELNKEQQIELITEYTRATFIEAGMIADVAIHDKSDGNPHAHILLTKRDLLGEGFGLKNREWDKDEALKSWRAGWADHANRALELHGHAARIDHRTLTEQGREELPTVHEGYTRPAALAEHVIGNSMLNGESVRLDAGLRMAPL